MIRSRITNKDNKLTAEVNDDSENEAAGLVVATRPLKTLDNALKFFVSGTYGVDMNLDASAGGTPVPVHNGIDAVYWTGSEPVGTKATFNSSDRANSGSNSVKWDNPALNDVIQFDRGSDLTVSGYASLTLYVNVDKDWSAGDSVSIFGWDTGTTSVVGSAVLLEDYINELDFDTWQKVTIPLSAMGLTSGTIDALRAEMAGTAGKAPKFYLDDIQFEETGTPIEFTLAPETGKWLYVDHLTISMADAYDSTVANGTVQGLAHDQFLGVAISSGMIYKRVQNSETVFSLSVTQLMDFLQLPGGTVQSGSDGTNTWISLNIPLSAPIILKPEQADNLSFTINDDLSGLLWFRVSAGCREEIRG